MGKNLSISSFKKLPIAFLSSFLLFSIILTVSVELEAFWRFCYFFSNPVLDDSIRMEAQLRVMPETDEKTRIFLTGSSQTREDFDVKYLNGEFEKAGLAFYNLGVAGGGQAIDMFMLKDKLLAKKPDIIICVLYVASFYDDYDFSFMRYYFDPIIVPYMSEQLGVSTIITYREYFIDSLLGKLWVPYKHRHSIKEVSKTVAKHFMNIERRTEPKLYAYENNKPKSYFKNEIKEANGNKYHTTQNTELNKYLFTRFANDIITSEVKLIVISGPTHPLIREVYKEEIDLSFNNFLFDKANEVGFVYLSENQLPLFTEADFIDFTHLNALGRYKLSRFLSIYIQENAHLAEP